MEQTKSLNNEEVLESTSERYIQFQLGNQIFAAPLKLVKEVIPLPELTPIPKAPAHLKGLMNLRGHVITVADLHSLIPGIQVTSTDLQEDEKPVIMIIGYGNIKMGAIVDRVASVLNLTEEQIASSRNIQSKSHSEIITGIFQNSENEHTTFVDILKVLKVKDLT